MKCNSSSAIIIVQKRVSTTSHLKSNFSVALHYIKPIRDSK